MSEFTWCPQLEEKVVRLKKEGKTYKQIAHDIGSTLSSVKHKVRRLQQNNNLDRYKHTKEKIEQLKKYLKKTDIHILETHCGFGSLSEYYNLFGEVLSIDIDANRIKFLNNLGLEGVTAIKADSEKEIYSLVFNKCKFDVVDIDPYGFPSRFFPHCFHLIDDGYLFLTFPVLGVAQINKITIQHYKSFWGITLNEPDKYIEKIKKKLFDYAFMAKKSIEVKEILKINRIYRFVIKVKKESLLKIVGLKVNR
tara:strand:+ start:37 stop:789 length:753 start_codon:yes stop_codon:yes gene_type:complete